MQMTAEREGGCGDRGMYTWCWVSENLLLGGGMGVCKWQKGVNLN